VANGAAIQMNADDTLAVTGDASIAEGSFALGSKLTVGGQAGFNSLTVAGAITVSGDAGFANNTSSLTLSGTLTVDGNLYFGDAGPYTIDGGTLAVGSLSADSSTVRVNGGGTLSVADDLTYSGYFLFDQRRHVHGRGNICRGSGFCRRRRREPRPTGGIRGWIEHVRGRRFVFPGNRNHRRRGCGRRHRRRRHGDNDRRRYVFGAEHRQRRRHPHLWNDAERQSRRRWADRNRRRRQPDPFDGRCDFDQYDRLPPAKTEC
jgi:hypothetical protein